jgi:phytanoyl-CoA hydroxylase
LKRQEFLPRRDVLVWHGRVLHEGTRVNDKARTRRSYVSHYTSLGAYPKDHMLPDALRAGAYTMLNGGYVFDHP